MAIENESPYSITSSNRHYQIRFKDRIVISGIDSESDAIEVCTQLNADLNRELHGFREEICR